MVIVDLDELEAAQAVIARCNSVTLDQIEWVRNGERVAEASLTEADNWRFLGLSNATFAAEFLHDA